MSTKADIGIPPTSLTGKSGDLGTDREAQLAEKQEDPGGQGNSEDVSLALMLLC